MADFTLPFEQTATKLNADGTAFEVDCQGAFSVAIAGKSDAATGVYGEAGGPFPQNLVPIHEKVTASSPGAGAARLVGGPGFLIGGVVGQTNLQNMPGVCGASQYERGVWGLSDSGVGVQGNSANGAGVNGNSTNGMGIVGVSQTQDAINGTSSAPGHAGVSANNNNGGYGLWADSPNGTAIYGQGKIAGHFNGGVEVYGTIEHGGDYHCTGTVMVDKDVVLKGADFAEDFTVETSESVEPGTVMVLDENGALRPCEKSYDRKVAGVISGAGDYRPGLILDRQKSSEGRLPLALVGKVYCNVDATYGAIEVGDLLTTSPTPGHAMRASDPLKAFGAVIGKALRPLNSGQRLVLILVALQ